MAAPNPSAKWTTDQIPSLAGKTALITGANSGIGYQAALELARHGAHVLLGVRNLAKGQAALDRLRLEARSEASPEASAEMVELDLASLASIRSFAAQFLASGRPLDLLLNNAGVMALPRRELTPDGYERQFATNHLGHFALTGLLIPALLQAPAPRVVTVASLAHRNGKIDFDNLMGDKNYVPWDAYNNSKLANLLFAFELDRRARAASSKLLSIPVHPGISQTSIVSNGPGWKDPKSLVLAVLSSFIMQSDAAGALPTLFAATAPNAKGGQYVGPDGFMEMKGSPAPAQPRPQALDEAVAARLWIVSEQLTAVTYPPLG